MPLKEMSLCCFLTVSCPMIVFGFEEAVMSLENLWDDHVEMAILSPVGNVKLCPQLLPLC